MSNPYPLPRSIRETEWLKGDGRSEYGPFEFKIFDLEDVQVRVRSVGDEDFEIANASIVKVSASPFDNFKVIFPQSVGSDIEFQVRGMRVHERTSDQFRGGSLKSDEVEKVSSQEGVVLQEVRRDVSENLANVLSERMARKSADQLLEHRIDAVGSLIGQSGPVEVPVYDSRLALTLAIVKPTVNSVRTAGRSTPGDGGDALYKRVPIEPEHDGKAQSEDGAWWEEVPVNGTLSDYSGRTVAFAHSEIRTTGFYSNGDGGGGRYRRVVAQPSHPGKFQSADGAWWELAELTPTIEMFGAVGASNRDISGLPDVTPYIIAAFEYLRQKGGGAVQCVKNYYRQTTVLVVGDGGPNNVSSLNGISLYGRSGGVTAEEFDEFKSKGTVFIWDGNEAVNPLDCMLDIRGPINNVTFQDLLFDCRAKRGVGIKANIMYFCRLLNVHCINWWFRGWQLETYSADYPIPGFSQWFFSNTFERCSGRMPAYDGPLLPHSAIWMSGDVEKNVGFSRNRFVLCDFCIPDRAEGVGMYLKMVDNCTFDRVFVFYDTGDPTGPGVGVYLERNGPIENGLVDKFPCDNVFINCPIFGGFGGASGTAGNLVIGDATVDLQPEPKIEHLTVIRSNGKVYGLRGSPVQWSAIINPSSGLGTNNSFLSLCGVVSPQAIANDSEMVIPGDMVLSKLVISLATAPGGSATRGFYIFKNGIRTTAAVLFSSVENGVKSWDYSDGITFTGIAFKSGDLISIASEVGGVPTNSKASIAVELQPR